MEILPEGEVVAGARGAVDSALGVVGGVTVVVVVEGTAAVVEAGVIVGGGGACVVVVVVVVAAGTVGGKGVSFLVVGGGMVGVGGLNLMMGVTQANERGEEKKRKTAGGGRQN